jgi:hypothetical protein
MILLQMAGEHMRICQQLQELTTVTTSESLLQWARERTGAICDSGQWIPIHWPERRLLIVGDAVIGHPPGHCGLLREKVIDAPGELRHGTY